MYRTIMVAAIQLFDFGMQQSVAEPFAYACLRRTCLLDASALSALEVL